MNIKSNLNFHVEETDLNITPDFLDNAFSFYDDRILFRGHKELLSEIEELVNEVESLVASTFYLAYSDDVLCGLAWAYLKDDVIKIPVFVVQAQFREIGVGDYLFNTILNSAQFKSAFTFESGVLPGEKKKKNFFEQHAGKTRKLVVQGIINDAKTEQ